MSSLLSLLLLLLLLLLLKADLLFFPFFPFFCERQVLHTRCLSKPDCVTSRTHASPGTCLRRLQRSPPGQRLQQTQ